MKLLLQGVAVVVVLIVVTFFGYVMFGGSRGKATGDVAKDKVKGAIEEIFGKIAVDRKQIENGMEAMDKAEKEISIAKFQLLGSSKLLGQKISDKEEQLKKVDTALSRIRPALDSKESVVFGGVSYTLEDIQKSAAKLLNSRKQLESATKEMKTSQVNLKMASDKLAIQQEVIAAKRTDFKQKLASIDNMLIEAKAYEKASNTMGSGPEDFSAKVEALGKQLETVSLEVEAGVKHQREQWDKMSVEQELQNVDTLIGKLNSANLGEEIDKILPKE